MDFFNKLGKKTNDAYQSAKEKTAKISGEIKLKNKISELDDKINTEYCEIGKLVYEKMQVGEDASKEDITPKCEEISRLKDEISKAEAEILALKDVKKCVKCGESLASDAEFCSKCGEKQPKIEKVEVEISEETEGEAKETEVTDVQDVEDENKED